MRIWVAPLLLPAAAIASASGQEGFSRAELEAMSPAELAATFLAPETKASIIEGRLSPGLYSQANYSGVYLVTAPRKQGAGVCVRDGYNVYLTPVAGVSQETLQKNVPVRADGISHTPSSQIALAEDCASVEHFTHLIAVPPDIGEGVLRFVAHLRDKARARMPLGVEVECRSELPPNPCDQDIPRIVANLPVHSAHSIRKSYLQGARWEVWLNETVLPSPYWAIHLDDAPGRARKATLIWQIPAPF